MVSRTDRKRSKNNSNILLSCGSILIVFIFLVIVIGSCNRKYISKPSKNAGISEVNNYIKNKYDSNKDYISIKKSKNNKLLMKVKNVDVSKDSLASAGFSDITEEMMELSKFNIADKGIVVYQDGEYTDTKGNAFSQRSYAAYYSKDTLKSLGKNYPDVILSGNYPNFFTNSDAYYIYMNYSKESKKLESIDTAKNVYTLMESIEIIK